MSYGFAEEVETVDADIVKSVLSDLNLHTFVQKETREDRNWSEERPATVIRPSEKPPARNPEGSNPEDLLKKVLMAIKKQPE